MEKRRGDARFVGYGVLMRAEMCFMAYILDWTARKTDGLACVEYASYKVGEENSNLPDMIEV